MQRTSRYYNLKWIVECKPGKQAFFETIAAFNDDSVAEVYAAECRAANGEWAVYRVMERKGRGTFVEI